LGDSHATADREPNPPTPTDNFAQPTPAHATPRAYAAAPAVTRRRNEEPSSKVLHPVAEAPDGGGAERRKMGATAATGGWRRPDWCSAAGVLRRHPLPALLGCGLLLFMAVEYTIPMVPPTAPPLDLGFVATEGMHAAVAARPWLNSLLAALNTVSNPSHQPSARPANNAPGLPSLKNPFFSFLPQTTTTNVSITHHHLSRLHTMLIIYSARWF
jgi:hypothetical protein